MKLNITERKAGSKGTAKAIRREGNIPAIMYSEGKAGKNMTIKGDDFATALRTMTKGHLPTTIFTVVDEKGNETRALVKDVQYHPTSYRILHMDLEEIKDGVPINVNVPIECIGETECAGIKLGGVLRRVIRRLRVRCLPADLPSFLTIDVKDMSMKQSQRLSDIELPANVSPLVDLNEVAVVIAKR